MKTVKPHEIKKVKSKRLDLDIDYLAREVSNVIDLSKYRGPKGGKGEAGKSGEQGIQGTQGDTGSQGARGPYGAAGLAGKKGISGPDGRRGRVGRQGTEGPMGSPGPKGDKGDKGDPPEHQWEGSKLRFRMPNGTWGRFINLQGMTGGRGRAGQDGSGGFGVKEIWDEITLVGNDLIFRRNKIGSLGEDVTVDLSGLSAGGSWGSISGTLSDQTDLQAELDFRRSVSFFLGE